MPMLQRCLACALQLRRNLGLCVARDVCDSKDTLGDLLRRHPDLFPKPVDQIVEKAWGYTSNYGRHLTEGKPPEFDEAELVVGLSGVLSRYLSRRFPRN